MNYFYKISNTDNVNLPGKDMMTDIDVEGLSICSQIVISGNLFRNGRDENSGPYPRDRGQR